MEDVFPESTGTAVAEAVVPFSTVAAEVARTKRFTLFVSPLRVRSAPTKTMNCFQADAGPKVRQHRAVVAHVSSLSPAVTILGVVSFMQMMFGSSTTFK